MKDTDLRHDIFWHLYELIIIVIISIDWIIRNETVYHNVFEIILQSVIMQSITNILFGSI